MKWITFFLVLISNQIFLINAQDFGVGNWRDHLPYSSVKQIAQVGNTYYAATAHSLIEFDNSTNEVRKLSTVNGLSEVGISCIVSN